jgi:hypothetical protein
VLDVFKSFSEHADYTNSIASLRDSNLDLSVLEVDAVTTVPRRPRRAVFPPKLSILCEERDFYSWRSQKTLTK